MNPGILHELRNKAFRSRSQEQTLQSSIPHFPHPIDCDQSNKAYRRIFPHRPVVYGSLIPPGGSLARAVMGNSNSCDGTEGPATIDVPTTTLNSATSRPKKLATPSNLTAMLDQQSGSPESHGTLESRNSQCLHDEADSASGPPPPKQGNIASDPALLIRRRSMTPPGSIPSTLNQPALGSSSDSPSTKLSASGPTGKVRRCMSSKEIGSLGLSGSPYAFMLQQKEELERRFSELLKHKREESLQSDGSRYSVPEALFVDPSDDSSSLSSAAARRGRMANEMRNRRRAKHNRAVTEDLCDVVTDMFVAESKLLKAATYGVESTTTLERDQVWRSVQRFVAALPSRYSLGVETPSEVLVHMRLMAAIRSNPTKAVVHIMNLEDNGSHPSNPTLGTSRRLVTIACADKTGLLEYLTKLLASGGSRVLDADVMLSSDNIVLDRFVVEMHGRLRLDKLAKYIECFLENSSGTKLQNLPQSSVNSLSTDPELSVTSSSKNEPSGAVYFSPPPDTPDKPTEQELQNEIEGAVPLTKVLESSGKLFPLRANGGSFTPLSRHMSLPPVDKAAPPPISAALSSISKDGLSGSLPRISLQRRTEALQSDVESIRKKRPLVNRRGSSDLDRVGSYDGEMSIEYVTLDVAAGDDPDNGAIPLIPFDELMLIEMLGAGRVSTIYRAVWQRVLANQGPPPYGTNMLALKVAMVSAETFDTSRIDELRREADIAARLHHPNICDLIGIAADSECFCIAYEYCEGGSLLSLLSDTSRYYEYLPIALDIANGMAYLHSRNVIHRDLKPSNILLTRDHRAKVSDFGMSVANTGQELTAETGTYRYMAPEVIRHEKYSSNADVYSFGLCLWQLITREVPFATMTPIQAAYSVAEGRRPTIPSSTPRRLQEIIMACWDQDSQKRPSFTFIAMALADYVRTKFSPASVGAQTLQIANDMLANVEGNSTVNVDFTAGIAPIYMGLSMHQDDSVGSNIGLEI